MFSPSRGKINKAFALEKILGTGFFFCIVFSILTRLTKITERYLTVALAILHNNATKPFNINFSQTAKIRNC